eukprot:TRINITY_DN10563_c2_g1_i1.p1 TRINITY_DN10563_c2_g1~~TRINITY_DN10563_c2_g1_i1.p1  ORF type:complete len:448 (-),score=72.97 TRINITY_DN10563_c2_g1_i1:85-1428(-)
MATEESGAPPDKEKKEEEKPLPPAKSIFDVESSSGSSSARCGSLLGQKTPNFTHLTSRGLPIHLRPEELLALAEDHPLFEIPICDLLLRQDTVKNCPNSSEGLSGFLPHFRNQTTYCSFRNPRQNPSVHGGDAICSVETWSGRRKVGPKEALEIQKVMRATIVAAPGEEVSLDVSAARRSVRAVSRASDWLKEILESKASDPELGFDWHVLASIQGGGEVKQRQKACASAAKMPVAGYWIGGLGYSETLPSRAKILEAVDADLPKDQPRFLPLCEGNPIEVLQAVLLGVDMLEIVYPTSAAQKGIALIFSTEMPDDAGSLAESEIEALVGSLMPPKEGETQKLPPKAVRQLNVRSPECREDFNPLSPDCPVKQYSRAYLYHLHEVHELLGTMLLAKHNLYRFRCLFAAIREHIQKGTIRQFVAWFLHTQTCEPPAETETRPAKRQRK